MSPENDESHDEPRDELRDSPLSPADDERIRRLLAEARHTAPMPEEVAARLDGVLRDLVTDRDERALSQPAAAGPKVVELAARRRRTAANLLIAAAAVIAVGIGISQVLPQGMSGNDAASPTADEVQDGDNAVGGDAGGQESAPEEPPRSAEGETVRLRSKRFSADLRRLQEDIEVKGLLVDLPSANAYRADCVGTDVGAGEVVPATYDGAPALVVLRAPSGDVQVVDLYVCGDTEPRRSITLTLP